MSSHISHLLIVMSYLYGTESPVLLRSNDSPAPWANKGEARGSRAGKHRDQDSITESFFMAVLLPVV